MRTLTVALLLLGASAQAKDYVYVQPKDTETVVEALQNPGRLPEYAFAVGYLWGIDSGIFAIHPCYVGAKRGTTNGQLASIFLTEALKNKEYWGEKNSLLKIATFAFMEAYPCEEKDDILEPSADIVS